VGLLKEMYLKKLSQIIKEEAGLICKKQAIACFSAQSLLIERDTSFEP
jgi:hypothetical protein